MHLYLAGFIVCLAVLGLAAYYCSMKNEKRFEQEKHRQSEEFEKLNKLAGELAHEIKNPLSTIKVNLQLISEHQERRRNRVRDRTAPEKRVNRLWLKNLQ